MAPDGKRVNNHKHTTLCCHGNILGYVAAYSFTYTMVSALFLRNVPILRYLHLNTTTHKFVVFYSLDWMNCTHYLWPLINAHPINAPQLNKYSGTYVRTIIRMGRNCAPKVVSKICQFLSILTVCNFEATWHKATWRKATPTKNLVSRPEFSKFWWRCTLHYLF